MRGRDRSSLDGLNDRDGSEKNVRAKLPVGRRVAAAVAAAAWP